MKPAKLITFLASIPVSFPVLAQEEGIDERINQAVEPFADGVSGFIFSSFPVNGVDIPFVLVWLLRLSRREWLTGLGLGLVIGGAIGDRIQIGQLIGDHGNTGRHPG